MHPNNAHKNGYPMDKLCKRHPALKAFITPAKSGQPSIDFANPAAVKALNTALLAYYYNMTYWDIPAGYLCPPVPGRADYLHGIADLLQADAANKAPRASGSKVKGLDIGVGANAIYPILGSQLFGWQFVGSDIDKKSIENCQTIIQRNPPLSSLFSVRHQPNKACIFSGIIHEDDYFSFTMCNPPFHKSASDANKGSVKKVANLSRHKNKRANNKGRLRLSSKPPLNFEGQSNELWCDGGELAFIQTMIKESVVVKSQVGWFTCLVSKSAHLKAINTSLNYYNAAEIKTLNMGQGQKQSRFVAWRF